MARRTRPLLQVLAAVAAALVVTAVVAIAVAVVLGPLARPVGVASPRPTTAPTPVGSAATSADAGAGPSASASSAPPVLGPSVVSADSPFADCPVGAAPRREGVEPSRLYENAEVEPWLVVDPTDPGRILVAWQQDRWSDGGARGLVTGVSHDGGATWSRTWPAFSTCAGGPTAAAGGYDRASDPWLAVTAGGTVLQTALATSADKTTSAILVSRSTDGGLTWSPPTTIARDTVGERFNDKETVTAHPTDPRLAWVIWDRSSVPDEGPTEAGAAPTAVAASPAAPSPGAATTPGAPPAATPAASSGASPEPPAFATDLLLSLTTDGGLTWTEPLTIFLGAPDRAVIGGRIAVLPDETLVAVAEMLVDFGRRSARTEVVAFRSADLGRTWGPPVTVAEVPDYAVPEPGTDGAIRSGWALPEVAVDAATGRVLLTWADRRFGGDATGIALATSDDGGATWSEPVRVDGARPASAAFTPSVEVAPGGSIAVSFVRMRTDVGRDDPLPTEIVIARSGDRGRTWREDRLTAEPFDLRAAPRSGGLFLGDYTGLGALDGRTLAAFAVADGDEPSNPTDIVVSVTSP